MMCKRFTCFVAVVAMVLAVSAGVSAQETADQDNALLNELGGDDLLEGLDDIPVDPNFKEKENGKPTDTTDQELLDQLGEGEDIQLGGEDELTRIARQMRDVQQRIAGEEVSRQTQQLQEKIVADLDDLIRQLEQAKKKRSSSSSAPSQPRNQDVNQPDQQPNADQQPSDKPAQDSQERIGRENAQAIDAASMEALIKRVWGHLPDKARQELQNANTEEFLPKYQQVIEDYFRRLAEETR